MSINKKDIIAKYTQEYLLELFQQGFVKCSFYKSPKGKHENDHSFLTRLTELIDVNDEQYIEKRNNFFSNFQWIPCVTFKEQYLPYTDLVNKIAKNNILCGSIPTKKSIEHEITYELYEQLPLEVKRFIFGKLVPAVILKKGEIGQFSFRHLEKEELGKYYIFTLLFLNKHRDNKELLESIASHFFNSDQSIFIQNNLNCLDFLQEFAFKNENNYFIKSCFSENTCKKLVYKFLNHFDENIYKAFSRIHKYDKDIVISFYDNYFNNQSSVSRTMNVKLFKLKTLPDYIIERHKDKNTFNLSEINPIHSIDTILSSSDSTDLTFNVDKSFNIKTKQLYLQYKNYFSENTFFSIFNNFKTSTRFNDLVIRFNIENSKNDTLIKVQISFNKNDFEEANKLMSNMENIIGIYLHKLIKVCKERELELHPVSLREQINQRDSVIQETFQEYRTKSLTELMCNLDISDTSINSPRKKHKL